MPLYHRTQSTTKLPQHHPLQQQLQLIQPTNLGEEGRRHSQILSISSRQRRGLILCLFLFLFQHTLYDPVLTTLVGKLLRCITLHLIRQTLDIPENSLWKASVVSAEPTDIQNTQQHYIVDVVVSHCNLPVDWIFTWAQSDFSSFGNVTILSKCQQPVVGAPTTATIVRLPNVGRCDHTYAHYMADYTKEEHHPQKNRLVLFLMDNDNHHRTVYSRQRSFAEMLLIVQQYGFACREERIWALSLLKRNNPGRYNPVCQISPFHHWSSLRNKSMASSYIRLARDKYNQEQFASTNGDTIDQFARIVGISIDSIAPLVQVCYGGNFMTLASQLSHKDHGIYQKMKRSLSRASNIAEGHFSERLWGALLAFPLNKTQVDTLHKLVKHPPCDPGPNFEGALTRY